MLGHLALDVKDLKAYRYQPKNANYYHNMDIPYIYIYKIHSIHENNIEIKEVLACACIHITCTKAKKKHKHFDR